MSTLHKLQLPDITRDCLTDLVLLQLDLLEYASQATHTLNEADCRKYLERTGSHFVGFGGGIAKWFFASTSKTGGRRVLLENFASACQQQAQNQTAPHSHAIWLQRIRKEVDALLTDDTDPLEVGDFFEGKKTTQKKGNKIQQAAGAQPAHQSFQEVAGTFFLYFYDTFLKRDETLPASIFTHRPQSRFGRQVMLAAFIKEKEHENLEMCAICDQSRYYTQGMEKIHSILDHYFPKSKYPHFACHPYNLVPVCYTCNSSIKGDVDPFLDSKTKQRRALLKQALPYRHHLSEQVYLDVKIGKEAQHLQITDLKPRSKVDQTKLDEIQAAIDLLKEVYGLPDRWFTPGQDLKLNEMLFRRIRHFLGDGSMILSGADVEVEVYNMLKQLLYYLDADDQRHDPSAFALTWILVAYLKGKKSSAHGDPAWRGLVAEVNSWSGQSLKNNGKRNTHVECLLEQGLQ
jgi:hypothetical protein